MALSLVFIYLESKRVVNIFSWVSRPIAVVALCLLSWAASAQVINVSEKRIALVIGNASYEGAPLSNPVNDAKLLKTTLSALGFEVMEGANLDAEGMKSLVRSFASRLQETPGAVGLFYFAGHGVQIKGVNYLLPVGRNYANEADIEDSAINAEAVVRRVQESGAKLSFVVLDACRNNPFAKVATRGLRLLVGGLARMDAPSGTLIAYSTATGSVASDGSGANGLYTQHLVRNMKVPGITAEQMFKRTREGVELESGSAQSPREESSLKGADFMFLPLAEGRKVNPELVELTYWESIRSSPDSGDFELYLKDYPAGRFSLLAKQSLEKIKKAVKLDTGLHKVEMAHASVLRGDLNRAEEYFQQLGSASSSSKADKARGREGLAELAMLQGQRERASALAEEALQIRPMSSSALLVKAQVARDSGSAEDVERLLAAATGEQSVSDFPWQKANALVALGNFQRKKQPEAAALAYEAAWRADSANSDALVNLITVLREGGQTGKALEWAKRASADAGSANSRVFQALAYQIQKDISERRDMDRQKQVDESVRELVARFKEQKSLPAVANADAWSSSPLAISVLGFQELEGSLTGRVGMDTLLGQELARELGIRNLAVVDRALIDKVLAELKLGSSALADPQTQLRLGKLTAARLIAVGRLFNLNGKDHVSLRLIDTETTQVVASRTLEAGKSVDPIEMSVRLAELVLAEVHTKYPAKGRLVTIEEDGIIVNVGRAQGLLTGDTFKVLAEGVPIEFNGKVIGMRESSVGLLRIARVDESMAIAVPVEKKGVWSPNLRVVSTRATGP